MQRHISSLYPTYKKDRNQKPTRPKEENICAFSNCGLVFQIYRQLKKHKSDTNHFVRKWKMAQNNQPNIV